MSFSGAGLILAIIVVRAVAIDKFPKKTFLFLWSIVLVRLLIPFTIPSSLSVYSLVNPNSYEETPLSNMVPIISEGQLESAGEDGQVHQFAVQTPYVSVWHVIWCIGVVLCIAFFALFYLCWLLRFKTAHLVRNSNVEQWLNAHRLKRSISIRQSDSIDAPLTYGLFRPVILMPKDTDWENTGQLQYILMHEYVHICRFDTATKLISTLAVCIHWFNPLVWVMYLLFNRDLELSCDESVVRRFGMASRSAYANMLISMEAKKSGLMPFYNNFSKTAIEERVTSIMRIRKVSLFTILIAVIMIIGITATFATSAAEQPERSVEPTFTDDYGTSFVVAYLRDVTEDYITVDVIEFVTSENAERIKELNLTEEDMPDGYYIYNQEHEMVTWEFDSQTVYTFIDWNGDFTGSDYPEEYTTMDIQEFQQYVATYEDSAPGMPFFFQVESGVVKLVLEKFFA